MVAAYADLERYLVLSCNVARFGKKKATKVGGPKLRTSSASSAVKARLSTTDRDLDIDPRQTRCNCAGLERRFTNSQHSGGYDDAVRIIACRGAA